MIRFQDEALVLLRTPFRETSLLLHLFTRHHGTLTAMARGVRTSGRRTTQLNQAALAGFHTVAITHQARSVQALGVLTVAEITQSRQHLLHSATALLAAQVAQETIYRFMPPAAPQPEVFELLEWAWNMLNAGAEPLAVAAICQGRLVRAFGYGWRTDCCVGCGTVAQLHYFSSKRGQVVCAVCAAPYAHRLFPLGETLYTALQQLEWTESFCLLSSTEKAIIYRIGMDSLAFLARYKPHLRIRSDSIFRQMVTASHRP